MTIHQMVVAQATYAVDYNPVADTWIEESKYLRRLKRVGFTCGTGLGEGTMYLSYGGREVGRIFNNAAGSAFPDAHVGMYSFSSRMLCLPTEEFHCRFAGASGTNPALLHFEFEEVAPPRGRRRFGRRRFGRRRGFRRFRR